MIYKERKNSKGYFHNGWTNNNGDYHRLDGPAYINYYPNGSIRIEEFWINGKYIGCNEIGFWNLWNTLTEVERQAPYILSCLARYS